MLNINYLTKTLLFNHPLSGLCRAGEMNRQILKVSFNRFDADAQGGGNFLSGYMPILFHHLHNTGVNVFGLEFRVVGIYMQISAMEIVSGSKHKVREEGIQRVPVFVYAFSDICVVGSHKGVPEKAGACGQWDNYLTNYEDLMAVYLLGFHMVDIDSPINALTSGQLSSSNITGMGSASASSK